MNLHELIDWKYIDLLVEAGAGLTAPRVGWGTPLHVAAWFGQPDSLGLPRSTSRRPEGGDDRPQISSKCKR